MEKSAKRARMLKPSDEVVGVLEKHIHKPGALLYTEDLDDPANLSKLQSWGDMLLELR